MARTSTFKSSEVRYPAGLLAPVSSPAEVDEDDEFVPEYPEGTPDRAWKVAEIDAWAADQDPVVVFPEGATRNQKLAFVSELLLEEPADEVDAEEESDAEETSSETEEA